ncbi:MAG: hypothetical protein ACYCX6_00110 [Vulcanimicrobiaceae bacterium]
MSARAVTASFVYTDADGRPLARVDRVEPGRNGKAKKLFPYLTEGDGFAEKSGLKGATLPIYRLGEVRRAIEREELVIFVEGEGKCDALREALRSGPLHAAVTTLSGGANAPLEPEHLEQLRGAQYIAVLADADAPGRACARTRSERLAREFPEAEVRTLDLHPDRADGHDDVADWLREGHCVDELLELIDKAPCVTVSEHADGAAAGESADDEAIVRLARLSPSDYEHERQQAAKKLGMRVSTLDDLVKGARRVQALAQGSPSSCYGRRPGGEAETDAGVVAALRPPSIATKIVQLLEPTGLLRDGDRTYASFFVNGHQETHLIMSVSFRRYAIQEFFKQYDAAPNGTALAEALATLDAKARFDGQSCIVATRCAEHGGRLYLDLTNDEWTVVEISADGWKIVPAADLTVRFVRTKDALPLPSPDPAGRLCDVDAFLPDDKRIRTLVKAFMVGALRPNAPQPVLPIIAPQGAGKSTIARLIKKTFDPTCSDLHGAPHEARDVTAAARNSYLLAFDNLSVIEPWLSDILCRLSTGGGFGGRQLFTNDEETIFDAIRPVIVTAIDDVIIRGDLADRALTIRLPARDDDVGYIEEDAFWEKFELARASILGGLLTAASAALRRLPETRAGVRAGNIRLPRMADFALFGTAAEQELGIEGNSLINLLKDERNSASVAILESDVIFAPLSAVIEKETFSGYPADLLAAINAKLRDDDPIKRDRHWPKTTMKLRNQIKRLEPDLRRAGIVVTWANRDTHTKRQMLSISLVKVAGTPPQPPQPPQTLSVDQGPAAGVAEVVSPPLQLVTEPVDV